MSTLKEKFRVEFERLGGEKFSREALDAIWQNGFAYGEEHVHYLEGDGVDVEALSVFFGDYEEFQDLADYNKKKGTNYKTMEELQDDGVVTLQADHICSDSFVV